MISDRAARSDRSALSQALEKSLLLVMANKQDLKGALTAAQISDGLGLTDLKDREWQILATSALTGQGACTTPPPPFCPPHAPV